MEPMHIALDLDDVVLDFVAGICEVVNRDFGANVQPNDVTDWNFGQFIDQYIGRDWWLWLEDHAWLWGEKFKPVPGAIGGIEKLRRAGHYIEIVTAKPTWAEDALWTWLARYKPRVHRLTIVPLVEGGGTTPKSKSSDADILVDDRWENCEEWVVDGRPALLYTRPHNAQRGVPPTGVVRVHSWKHILNVFENNWIEWPDLSPSLAKE